MQHTWRESLLEQQQSRRNQNLWRERRTLSSGQGSEIRLDGQTVCNFSSNDYLGLAGHAELARVCGQAASKYGVGSGASHLVGGHLAPHHELEQALALALGAERALLFSTGYMANLSICTALAGKSDLILQDKLNHASLIDGGQSSQAKFRRYAHANVSHAEQILQQTSYEKCLMVTDGVFSMDGDRAPLSCLKRLADTCNGLLVVDDAHGFGVCGPDGRGSLAGSGLAPVENVLMMGTLGKALGSFGAFVAGDAIYIEQLMQTARAYIYTTALPPATASVSLRALQLWQEQGHELQRALFARVEQFKAGVAEIGLSLLPSDSAIQPILVGDCERALRLSDHLMHRGFYVGAIRPPTVATGTARLRVTLSATHTGKQVDGLLAALAEACRVTA